MTWHVALCDANAENKVAQCLNEKGMTTYFPKLKYPVIIRHSVVIRERAAFSRYIFLSLPCIYHQLLHIPGLCYLMKHEGHYSELDDGVIDGIKRLEQNGFFTHDSIRVHALQAKLLTMTKQRNKAKVTIRMFGADREATVTV